MLFYFRRAVVIVKSYGHSFAVDFVHHFAWFCLSLFVFCVTICLGVLFVRYIHNWMVHGSPMYLTIRAVLLISIETRMLLDILS